MKRIVHKFSSFAEAEAWDIAACVKMSVEQRQAIARELRIRAYGEQSPDVRESYRLRQAEAVRKRKSGP
jgi:hypothetical protein